MILSFFIYLTSKQINEFKIQDDSEVLSSDFLGHRNLCSLIDLSSLCNLIGLNNLYSPISSKKLLILMVWSSIAPKWPIPVPFCEMDHQKFNFSLISDTLSVRGWWGQPALLFWKLFDETQMPHIQDIRTTLKQILACVFPSVRLNSKRTFQYEIPCIRTEFS